MLFGIKQKKLIQNCSTNGFYSNLFISKNKRDQKTCVIWFATSVFGNGYAPQIKIDKSKNRNWNKNNGLICTHYTLKSTKQKIVENLFCYFLCSRLLGVFVLLCYSFRFVLFGSPFRPTQQIKYTQRICFRGFNISVLASVYAPYHTHSLSRFGSKQLQQLQQKNSPFDLTLRMRMCSTAVQHATLKGISVASYDINQPPHRTKYYAERVCAVYQTIPSNNNNKRNEQKKMKRSACCSLHRTFCRMMILVCEGCKVYGTDG